MNCLQEKRNGTFLFSVIDDIKIIQEIVKKSGMRSITVARHKTTKEKEQGDVERQ